jgi:hypothetical protein
MQTELREAVKTVYKHEALVGAIGLIGHLAKACFVQGLHSERMQTIVRSRNESISLRSLWRFQLRKKAPSPQSGKNQHPV